MNPSAFKPNDAVTRMARFWAVVNPLMGGTVAMRDAGKSLLPQFPMEEDDAYKERLQKSTLFPAYQLTVNGMVDRVFSSPLQLGEDVPEQVNGWCEDIDMAGHDISAWSEELARDAMGKGIGLAFVDAPVRDESVRTQADAKRSGLRPHAVRIAPEALLGWRLEGSKLTKIWFSELVKEPDPANEFGEIEYDQVRVLEPGKWRVYRKGKDGYALHAEGEFTVKDRIPLVVLYGYQVADMEGKPPLLELAHLNVKHWQSQSDQDNILHTIRVPILVRTGYQPPMNAQGEQEFTASVGTMNDLPEGGDMKFVEHTGKAVEAGRQSLLDLIDEMRMAGAYMLRKDRTGTMTATQAKTESDERTSPLQRFAGQLQDVLEQLLIDMADMGSVSHPSDSAGSVEVRGNFDEDWAPEVFVPQLVSMANMRVISKQTLFDEMKRRNALSQGVVWEDELERLEQQGPDLGALDFPDDSQ